MQRGLRINPSARKLWLQYFRLEFYYVEKLAGRRELLGLEGEGGGRVLGAAGADTGVGQSEGGDGGASGEGGGGPEDAGQGGPRQSDPMDIPQLDGEGAGGAGPSFKAVRKASSALLQTATERGPVMNDTAKRFYRGAVPLAVFRAAVKAIPEDVEFRADFLRCCTLDFPALGSEVAAAILASVARDFPESSEAWELRASYPLLASEGSGQKGAAVSRSESAFGDCVALFEQAVEATGRRGPDIWMRYALFLQEMVEKSDESWSKGGRRRVGGTAATAVLPEASELVRLTQGVLKRAVAMHVDKNHAAFVAVTVESFGAAKKDDVNDEDSAATTAVAVTAAGRRLATGEEPNSEEAEKRHADVREALGVGLADTCLMLEDPEMALAALRVTTDSLPARPGPWLRLSSLERRSKALRRRVDLGNTTVPDTSHGPTVTPESHDGLPMGRASRTMAALDQSINTLRRALRTVPAIAPGYSKLWRELLSCLVAGGVGKKAIDAAFRDAIEACDPSGVEAVEAQGEFLTAYMRWSAAVEGIEAARRGFQWARRSFLLAGPGAAPAYLAVIELERTMGEEGGRAAAAVASRVAGGGEGMGGGRAKRVREVFEVSIYLVNNVYTLPILFPLLWYRVCKAIPSARSEKL